jgi:hypothetical protein
MGRFATLAAEVNLLSMSEQDEIADILDNLLHGARGDSFRLSEEEIAKLEGMVTNPGALANEADVKAFFAAATKAK